MMKQHIALAATLLSASSVIAQKAELRFADDRLVSTNEALASRDSVASVTGCYTLRMSAWSIARITVRLPGFIQLKPDSAVGSEGALSPDLIRGSVMHRAMPGYPQWKHVGADLIVLGWSDGFSGVTARMQIQGDTLRGVARTFSDDLSAPTAVADVSATRVACSEVGTRE
jgi:hypothetical protein